jgi:lipid-binding SYLF domain-containing protein
MRHILMAMLLAFPVAAYAQADQQQVVDRATLAAQDMLNNKDGTDAQSVLRRARAVMICPQVFRAGFVFGGQGGTCVLSARDGAGSWSSPAFYGLAGGSIGFQAGVQDAEVMLFIMTDKGLTAVMDSQFKLGADASGTFIDLGGGVEGSTTAALRADIVGFSRARGLFAGVSLGGSLMSAKSDWNLAYYGRPVAAQQVVVGMEVSNPAADPLRAVLMKFGAQAAPPAAPAMPAPVPMGGAPMNGGQMGGGQMGGGPTPIAPRAGAIQQQTLAPPPRQ